MDLGGRLRSLGLEKCETTFRESVIDLGIRAHMWLAAAQGEQRAITTLEMAERRMTPAQIAEAQKLARDWKPAAQLPSH